VKKFSAWILLVLLGPLAGAFEKSWIEIRTPHFVVFSNGSERHAREVALGFEQIHMAFAQGFPQLRTDSGAETIVLAPEDEHTMKELVPEFWEKRGSAHPAGLFRKGWEKDYAIVRLDEAGSDYEVVYHEYIHKLLELNFSRLPVWANEGLAEFFGNSHFQAHQTFLGAPSPRIYILREKTPYPLEALIKAGQTSPYYREEDKVGMFYAECWGLTHFLFFGNGMGNGQHFNQFLHLLQTGTDGEHAFEQAFGDPQTLEKPFMQYLSRFSFPVLTLKTPVEIDKSSFPARKLSLAETNAMLGSFYTYERNTDSARKRLTDALGEDPKLAMASEGMAFLDFQEGKDEEAEREFADALKSDPNLYLSLYYQSMLENWGKKDPESLARLAAALDQVLHINPNFAPAYVIQSRIYVRQQNLPKALEAALHAQKLEPDRAGYASNVAAILLLQHNFRDAIKIAKYVAARWFGPDSDEALSILRKARVAAGVQATKEELAEESGYLAYAKDTASVDGVIDSVTCSKNKTDPLQLVVTSGGKQRTFLASKGFGMGWSDTVWYGSDHFTVCHHLEGLQAVVRFKSDLAKPGQDEIRWLEIRDPIENDSSEVNKTQDREPH
jgi:tetratricopeptide (TPR) repeat protein